jgi:hypothetical protein
MAPYIAVQVAAALRSMMPQEAPCQAYQALFRAHFTPESHLFSRAEVRSAW